jgi:predicted DNA-binding protein (MmcQ/YjbR family)
MLFAIGPPCFGVSNRVSRQFAGQTATIVEVKPERIAKRIRELALSFPQAYEDAPWGFPVFKVGSNKLFALMQVDSDVVRITVKLTPEERDIARLLPHVRKAAYVGRYGWVTADITDVETLEAALEWVRESYWLKAPAELRGAVESDR